MFLKHNYNHCFIVIFTIIAHYIGIDLPFLFFLGILHEQACGTTINLATNGFVRNMFVTGSNTLNLVISAGKGIGMAIPFTINLAIKAGKGIWKKTILFTINLVVSTMLALTLSQILNTTINLATNGFVRNMYVTGSNTLNLAINFIKIPKKLLQQFFTLIESKSKDVELRPNIVNMTLVQSMFKGLQVCLVTSLLLTRQTVVDIYAILESNIGLNILRSWATDLYRTIPKILKFIIHKKPKI